MVDNAARKQGKNDGGRRRLQDRLPPVPVPEDMRGTKRSAGDDGGGSPGKKSTGEVGRHENTSDDEYGGSVFSGLVELDFVQLENVAKAKSYPGWQKTPETTDARESKTNHRQTPPIRTEGLNREEAVAAKPAPSIMRGTKRGAGDDGGGPPGNKSTGEVGRRENTSDDEYGGSVFSGLVELDFVQLENDAKAKSYPGRQKTPETTDARESKTNHRQTPPIRTEGLDREEAVAAKPAPSIMRGTKRGAGDDGGGTPGKKSTGEGGRRENTSDDDYDDSVFDDLSENDLALFDNHAEHEWHEDDSKLYLLDDGKTVGDAIFWAVETIDRPPPEAIVFNVSEDGVLNLTSSGMARLANVGIMVRDRRGTYKLYRTSDIDYQNLKEFCVAQEPREWSGANSYPENVYLRGERNEFRTIENYNRQYNNLYQRDAAQSRFAAFTGRPSRRDLPAISIRVDANTYQNLSVDNPDGNTIIYGREMLIQSAPGTALHTPPVAKLQNSGYVNSVGQDDQTKDALRRYRPQSCYPPLKVLVHENGKLVNGEQHVVVDHNYAPLVEKFEMRDIFLLNHNAKGQATGNYRQFSGDYHRMTFEQAQILGLHPPTERAREDSIPHAISYGTRVRIPPASTVDLEELRASSERLEPYAMPQPSPVDFDKLFIPPREAEAALPASRSEGRSASETASARKLDDRPGDRSR